MSIRTNNAVVGKFDTGLTAGALLVFLVLDTFSILTLIGFVSFCIFIANVRTFVFFAGMFVVLSKLAFVRLLFAGLNFLGFMIIGFPSRLSEPSRFVNVAALLVFLESLLIPSFTGDVVEQLGPVIRTSVEGSFWMGLLVIVLILNFAVVPFRDGVLLGLLPLG